MVLETCGGDFKGKLVEGLASGGVPKLVDVETWDWEGLLVWDWMVVFKTRGGVSAGKFLEGLFSEVVPKLV